MDSLWRALEGEFAELNPPRKLCLLSVVQTRIPPRNIRWYSTLWADRGALASSREVRRAQSVQIGQNRRHLSTQLQSWCYSGRQCRALYWLLKVIDPRESLSMAKWECRLSAHKFVAEIENLRELILQRELDNLNLLLKLSKLEDHLLGQLWVASQDIDLLSELQHRDSIQYLSKLKPVIWKSKFLIHSR